MATSCKNCLNNIYLCIKLTFARGSAWVWICSRYQSMWYIFGVPWPLECHLGILICIIYIYTYIYTGGKRSQYFTVSVAAAAVLKIWIDYTCLIWQQQFIFTLKVNHGKQHWQASLIWFIFLGCIKFEYWFF